MALSERERDRQLWAAVDRKLGGPLGHPMGVPLDPFRHHRACTRCGQRGPLVPRWKHAPFPLWPSLSLEERRGEPTTFVCADGCPVDAERTV